MKHKSKQYRRNQRNRHIEKKKRIIRNRWYYDFNTFGWNEDRVMPVTGKLSKGSVRDCMKECGSFNGYTTQEQKRAASMLDALKEQDELAGINGPLKSALTRVIKNNGRHRTKGSRTARRGHFPTRSSRFFFRRGNTARTALSGLTRQPGLALAGSRPHNGLFIHKKGEGCPGPPFFFYAGGSATILMLKP